MLRAIRQSGADAHVQRVGSMLTLFFRREPVRSWADADLCDRARFGLFHQALLSRGVYWPPSQFEAAFLGAAHTEDDVAETIDHAAFALSAGA